MFPDLIWSGKESSGLLGKKMVGIIQRVPLWRRKVIGLSFSLISSIKSENKKFNGNLNTLFRNLY